MKTPLSKLSDRIITVFLVSILLGFSETQAKKVLGDPYLTKSFTLSSGEIYVRTSGGSIRVEGSNTNKVKVDLFVKSRKHSDEKMRKILEEDYEISIIKSGSKIEAIAKRTGLGWTSNGINISFVIYAPRNFACDLNTSGGSLNISGLNGKFHLLKTSGGSITADDIIGEIEAGTSGGSININDLKGELEAHTSGGSINLEDIIGDIDVHTSGGGIKIRSVEGSVNAHTSGGSINANITELKDELVLKTSGGSVNATIPSGLGLDLDLRGNRVNTSLQNFSGSSKSDRVTGTVNGGGILVHLSTSGGSVNLNYD